MAEKIKGTLCKMLRIKEFSLQLDDSTLSGNGPLILASVPFIKDQSLIQ